MGKIITLDKAVVGQTLRILSIENENKALKRRIMDMGITKGVELSIVKIAPLGDPVVCAVRGYNLSLRKHELASITGEVITKTKKCDERVV